MDKEFIRVHLGKIDSHLFRINDRHSEKALFVILSAVGIIFSFLFRTKLMLLPYQFGIEALGLFIPPFLAGVFIVIVGLRDGFKYMLLFKAFLLFVIQLLPVFDLLFNIVDPNPGEDFARNLAYANYMIEHRTLWGADQLAYPEEGMAYITQPGYRYFLALEMLLFKNLYRFVSVLNIFFFITTLFLFLKSVVRSVENFKFRYVLALFLLLTIPYATKNILMGLSEWLMVSLLMLSVYFFRERANLFLSLVFLALVVFVRQNTLPSVLLLAFWVIFNSQRKIALWLTFIFVLFLPVYHNLYYAGEWRFFASIHQWPFFKYESPSKYSEAIGMNYLNVLNNVLHYLGIHIRNNRTIDFLEEAFLFLLSFPALLFYMQKRLIDLQLRLIFLLASFMIIAPTILIATHFYPRFEFVCVYFTIVTFLFLYKSKKEAIKQSASC